MNELLQKENIKVFQFVIYVKYYIFTAIKTICLLYNIVHFLLNYFKPACIISTLLKMETIFFNTAFSNLTLNLKFQEKLYGNNRSSLSVIIEQIQGFSQNGYFSSNLFSFLQVFNFPFFKIHIKIYQKVFTSQKDHKST